MIAGEGPPLQEPARLPAARTTAEAIAKAIRDDIVGGHYSSGDKLRQVELATRYGVSTTPVREAFGILQNQGLVRVHAQRGATVLVPTVSELEEHYEIRIALESLAVQHAAVRFQASDAPRFHAMLAEMRECRDPNRYVELNNQFHMAIYELSGRRRLRRDDRTAAHGHAGLPADQLRTGGAFRRRRARARRHPSRPARPTTRPRRSGDSAAPPAHRHERDRRAGPLRHGGLLAPRRVSLDPLVRASSRPHRPGCLPSAPP